jgi:polyisoprenoid-binding protein YceI
MSRRIAKATLLVPLLSACVLASPAPAAERVVTLDPKASAVSFTLGTTLHEVHGSMRLTGGALRFDPATGTASGEISVDARSAETGNARRDRKMHGSILESERYPAIVFRPQRVLGRVEESGRSDVKLGGTMSLHGGDHPMTLPVALTVEGGHLRAELRFEVPYVEWGMEDPSFLILRAEKLVVVTVRAEGRLGTVDAPVDPESR